MHLPIFTRTLAGCVSVALLWPVSPANAATVVIDDFSSGPFSLSAGVGGSTGADQTTTSAVGGNRTDTLYNPFGPPYGPTTATATLANGSNNLNVSFGYVLLGLGYGVRYNGGGSTVGTTSTALHLDLSSTNALSFDFTAVSGTTHIYVSYETISGNALTNNDMHTSGFTVSSPGIAILPYSALVTPGGGSPSNFNLSEVDFIDFSIQPGQNSSFSLAGISAVPEPGTWIMLLSGGAGVAALAVRKRFLAA